MSRPASRGLKINFSTEYAGPPLIRIICRRGRGAAAPAPRGATVAAIIDYFNNASTECTTRFIAQTHYHTFRPQHSLRNERTLGS